MGDSSRNSKKQKVDATEPVPWPLPLELTMEIIRRVNCTTFILRTAQFVCSEVWRRACKEPKLYEVMRFCKLEDDDFDKFELMVNNGVDRSQGRLVEFSVYRHAGTQLVNYVTSRSNNLVRLTLHDYSIDAGELADNIRPLPHLEELNLILHEPLTGEEIRTIGRACCCLKSFTYHQKWRFVNLHDNHEDDFPAIAETMSNLRHLRLISHRIKNEGLEAILDGCPHLQSLDIRDCRKLHLEGDLLSRCEKVATLRLPDESIDDLIAGGWSIKLDQFWVI